MTTVDKAMALIGCFETDSPDGFGDLTGDFDGMGWSHGVLQWNLGQGTVQGVIRDYHANGPETFARCCTVDVSGQGTVDLSSDLLALIDMATNDAVAWAAARCTDDSERHPLPHWIQVFRNFGAVPDYQAIQRRHAAPYLTIARNICEQLGLKTERGFTEAFDIAVQCGGIGPEGRAAFNASDPGPDAPEEQRLVALARAVAAASRYHEDVLSRKLCIAEGTGEVHGRSYDLAAWPGITLGPVQS